MSKKLYAVNVFQINYNTDTTKMKRDYSMIDNAILNGIREMAILIVYKDKDVFREWLSDVEIPYAEEKVYYDSTNKSSDAYQYDYKLHGNYPVFFVFNTHADVLNENICPQLEDLEASDEYVSYYKNFVKERYSDDNGNYKTAWKNQIIGELESALQFYDETLNENGYSLEYQKKIIKERN